MSMVNWVLVFYVFFLCLILICMACQIALRLTLDRRVRKELPDDKVYDGFYDTYFGIWRALIFANASILKGNRFQKTMAIFYNSFDVKNFANRFEKTVAWVHLVTGIVILLSLMFYFLTKWFGVIGWSD